MGRRYRQERVDRLVNPQSGPSGSFSADLLHTAKLMLVASLEDRKNNAEPPSNNHMSQHSVGSIVVLIAGFESWLNEALAHLSTYDPVLRKKGDTTLVKKYTFLCTWQGAGRITTTDVKTIAQAQGLDFGRITDDLRLAIEVRNEIVHPMPFATGTPWNVPHNLLRLHQMGLLMTTGRPDADYVFGDKLRSYALAYWCWEVVEVAVGLLVKHVELDQVFGWTAPNFSGYRYICAPKDLPDYDASEKEKPTIKGRIRQLAYDLYEKRGRQHGHDLDDWLQAENQILGDA